MKRVINVLLVSVYLCAVVIYAYPDLRQVMSRIENQKIVRDFEDMAEDGSGKDGLRQKDELYQTMLDYNKEIYEKEQSDLKDPWSFEEDSVNLDEYGVTDGVIGTITIPRMKLELPVYLGVKKEYMAKGAALLGQTSFPIEGAHVNSVIAAHRGWKGIPMFREIESLKMGDEVTVENLWETRRYQVTDIHVIMPDDIQEILICENKNMVTLITCHPYTKNSRRYIVRCEYVGTDADKERVKDEIGANQGNAQKVQDVASKEDKDLMEADQRGRKTGYLVLAVLALLLVATGRGKNR